jgi:alpha-ribazole phosphatase
MEIFLVRHLPLKLKSNLCYGHYDPQVDIDSKNMEYLIEEISGYCFDIVYSSPSRRCLETAKVFNLKAVEDHRLKELNFGEWEGKMWKNIDKTAVDNWLNNFIDNSPPKGESLMMLYDRCREFFEGLKHESFRNLLIITHAGVIRCAFIYFDKINIRKFFNISVDHNHIYRFSS